VDIKVLQNRSVMSSCSAKYSSMRFRQHPSEVVLFLGPGTRYFDKLPPSSLEPTAKSPRFMFFNCIRLSAADLQRSWFPTASADDRRLKGKIVHIRTPGDFAKAIRQLESRTDLGFVEERMADGPGQAACRRARVESALRFAWDNVASPARESSCLH